MSCMKIATVSDKGQISIPLDIREMMGIEKGDSLVLVADDDQIVVKRVENIAKKILDEEKLACLKLTENSLKKDWDNELDDRWNTV